MKKAKTATKGKSKQLEAPKKTFKQKKCSGKGIPEVKRNRALKVLIEGGSKKDACLAAGYAETTAHSKATEIIEDIVVKSGITDLMDKMGITDERLLVTLKEGLEAKKAISCNVIAFDGEGMKDANSMTKDFVDTEDYAVRHKYMESGLKLRGHLKDKLDVNLTVETFEQRMIRLGRLR